MIFKQHRRHRFGLLAAGYGRKRLDIEVDVIECVLGNAWRIRQDDSDGLADIANLAIGQHRLVKGLELRQRLQPQRDLGTPAPRSAPVTT